MQGVGSENQRMEQCANAVRRSGIQITLNSGNWLNGRLFNASSNPVFSAAHPSAAAVLTGGSNGVEEQDVTF